MKFSNYRFLNEFSLKIIAIVLMTIDHIGFLLLPNGSNIQIIFRCIGRLAMPLFVFMAVEGVYHTRNIWKYFVRLFVLAFIIDFVLALIGEPMGNIMFDLSMQVLTIYLLKKKNWYSLLAIIPAAILVLTDFNFSINGVSILHSDYGTFGLCLSLGFFISKELTQFLLSSKADELKIDKDIFIKENYQKLLNIISVISLVTISLIFYMLYRINYRLPILPGTINIQSWCIFSGIFIIFYNGKRGYNKTWFKYGSYLYYPLHIVIIYLISLCL